MRRGVNGVIPFAMKLVLLQVHSPNFLIRHLPAGRVFPAIQTTGYLEPFGSRRARNQIHDRLIIAKRLAAPIRGDEREQSVFHLIPFAGARGESDRRKSTDPFHSRTSATPISRAATVSRYCTRHRQRSATP